MLNYNNTIILVKMLKFIHCAQGTSVSIMISLPAAPGPSLNCGPTVPMLVPGDPGMLNSTTVSLLAHSTAAGSHFFGSVLTDGTDRGT